MYEEKEIHSIFKIILMDVFHYTNIDIHLRKHENLEESFVNKFREIIFTLKKGCPVQYIIGSTDFADMRFGLNPSTLIPRPETEELVYQIARSSPPTSSILDIGTGSGCIAVSLAKLLPQAKVSAIDISREALLQATENAENNRANVLFMERDILNFEQYAWDTYDIIVSNPPYVRESEKSRMHRKVLDFEPGQALFVPDEDPLLFYKQICLFGQQYLRPGGMLYFEINEALGKETSELLAECGYVDIAIGKDLFDKERFSQAKRL